MHREVRVVAELLEERPQSSGELGSHRDVESAVCAKLLVHGRVMAAKYAGVQLHDQPVIA